jgi:hypothetical protein
MSDFVNKTIGQLVRDIATRYPENTEAISSLVDTIEIATAAKGGLAVRNGAFGE